MENLPLSNVNYKHHFKRKRVCTACDSCRVKKTKCDGNKPCNACLLVDNICVFSRKKKEKSHLNEYVELMETRVDLLTKSLEKMIHLSRPHLPFLKEIMCEEEGGFSFILINSSVEYLTNNERLLHTTPFKCVPSIATRIEVSKRSRGHTQDVLGLLAISRKSLQDEHHIQKKPKPNF